MIPTEMAKALLRGEISNGCTCEFCTGKKRHEDNWCAYCANVQLLPPKHWENMDVCDECEKQIRTTVAIDRLRDLPDDWGGSEKPSKRAIEVASELVRLMYQRGRQAARDAAPMADGGIAVYYAEGDERRAWFDVYNEGGIVVATGRGGAMKYAELSETEAVEEMVAYLKRSEPSQ